VFNYETCYQFTLGELEQEAKNEDKLRVIVKQNTTNLNLPTRVKIQLQLSQNELRVVWSVFTEHGSIVWRSPMLSLFV
jgi:hypothetical protein